MFEVGKKYKFLFHKEPCVCTFVGTTISVFQRENGNDFCGLNSNHIYYPEYKEPLKGPVRYISVIRNKNSGEIFYLGPYLTKVDCVEYHKRNYTKNTELLDIFEIKWEEKTS